MLWSSCRHLSTCACVSFPNFRCWANILRIRGCTSPRRPFFLFFFPFRLYCRFRTYFEETLDLGLVEDNPKIWVCFADLMTICFTQQTFTYLSLNRLLPSQLISSDEMIPMLTALFKRLKPEVSFFFILLLARGLLGFPFLPQHNSTTCPSYQPNHIAICCNGHFELLQRLFAENRDTQKIDAFLKSLEEAVFPIRCLTFERFSASGFVKQATSKQNPETGKLPPTNNVVVSPTC